MRATLLAGCGKKRNEGDRPLCPLPLSSGHEQLTRWDREVCPLRFAFFRNLLVLGLLAVNASAAPNLTGAWRLNISKSVYGKFPAPSTMVRTILQDGNTLSMTTLQKGQQGEVTTTLKYILDGKAVTNTTATGDSTSIARWDAAHLVIETSRTVQGADLKSTETWDLSSDGKTLTIETHLTLPQQGEFVVKQVFEKQ